MKLGQTSDSRLVVQHLYAMSRASHVLVWVKPGLSPHCGGHAVFDLLYRRRMHHGGGKPCQWCEVVIHCCWWATVFSQVGVHVCARVHVWIASKPLLVYWSVCCNEHLAIWWLLSSALVFGCTCVFLASIFLNNGIKCKAFAHFWKKFHWKFAVFVLCKRIWRIKVLIFCPQFFPHATEMQQRLRWDCNQVGSDNQITFFLALSNVL